MDQLRDPSAQQNALLKQLTATCHLLCACASLGELCSVSPAVQCSLAQRGLTIVAHSGRAALELAVSVTFDNAEDPARVSGAILLLGPQLEAVSALLELGIAGDAIPAESLVAPGDLAGWLSAACMLANRTAPTVGQGELLGTWPAV